MTNISPGKAHFVGICGAGMSTTAMLLKESGWEITGSDNGCHPPVSDYLHSQHIPVTEGYQREHIPTDTTLVVAGGSAKLIPEENEQLAEAQSRGIPITTFPEIVGAISASKHTVTVVGSYGKSTMTALLAWCLTHAGKDPSYFIGALPYQMNSPAHHGVGDFFIVEGDEYPTSHTDPRSKFLHITARDIIFISAEHDHVNVFPTEESYRAPFETLLARLPAEGHIVACLDGAHVADIVSGYRKQVISYGLNGGNNPRWSAKHITHEKKTTFDLTCSGEKIASVGTPLLGDHNVQNIVGAAAFLLENDILTVAEFSRAIEDFQGVRRRLDRIEINSTIPVFEGFGSSRQKARAAIKAVVDHCPTRRLLVFFEPHAFSWRNKETLDWYDDVFEHADVVFIYPPPADGHAQVSYDEILGRARAHHPRVHPLDPSVFSDEIEHVVEENDALLILTSGNMNGLVQLIPQRIEELFPQRI